MFGNICDTEKGDLKNSASLSAVSFYLQPVRNWGVRASEGGGGASVFCTSFLFVE